MEIRPYRAGEEKDILKLFEITFKQTMSPSYWKWRFQENPISKPMIYLMWEGELLIGHYAVSPNSLLVDQKCIKSALSMTTMTHPEYGGKGIFTTLAETLYKHEAANDNLDIVWGFPNSNSHRGFIKNLQWSDIDLIPSFSLLTSKYLSYDEKSTKFDQISNISEKQINKNKENTAIYNITPFKNEKYYYWRYNLNPINNYVIFSDDNGNFVIVKKFISKKGIEIDIVEWAVSNSFELSKSVIDTILRHYEKSKPYRINLWLPLYDKRHINLEKIGFENHEPITYMSYRNLNRSNEPMGKKWFYQMGDSDVY